MKRAITAALLVVTMAAGVQAANKITTVPVQFAKGAHSAQVKGNFSGYDTLHYTLVAKAGQTMTVKISGSSNANFNVFPPGAIPGQAEALGRNDGNGQWQSTLPTSGKYLVQVYQMRASARRGEQVPHTLSVSIQ
ncbi:g-type lysozyme inhibitor [Aeromonas enteropelogenes]|uniref:g-type lysozyme inhibitor n=1 Tax=Aeromonas enteropelogenes TaxID=29489 RepID=UPI0005AAFD88|nr:g-type lysozyme inhibitor [Aeromonas enteropelogenes]UBH53539.1 g-type lysozyme inhibitor [Aeromonas enteropelogenes]